MIVLDLILSVLLALAYGALGAYALWLFYLAVMPLKRARDAGTLSRPAMVLGLPILWLGLLIDFLVNQVVATALFLEPPEETLVTTRLSRLIREDKGWRRALALWICFHLLDPFDPAGHHCDCEGAH